MLVSNFGVMVVPALKGGAGGCQSADNRPLYGRALADRHKFYRESTNLGTLCGSSEKEGFADPTFWWDQPMDLDLAKERGLLFPAQGPAGTSSVKN